MSVSTGCENHKKKLIGKKILENKLDGVRAISILYPSGKVDIFSRSKELHNFNREGNVKKHNKKKSINYPIVLDGEIVSKNFQNLMKQIHERPLFKIVMLPYVYLT